MPGLTCRFAPNYVKARKTLQCAILGEVTVLHYWEFIPAGDLAR
jgi:hypothetical protein